MNFCPRCGTPLQDKLAFGNLRRVCPACQFVHFHDPKVAAVIFVEQAGKVLLVKRGVIPELGKWALPAGYVDFGEDPRQTALREALEETGLVIDIQKLLDVFFTSPVIVIAYAAQVIGGTLHAGDDAEEAAWFAPHELPELAFESTQIILKRWVNQQI